MFLLEEEDIPELVPVATNANRLLSTNTNSVSLSGSTSSSPLATFAASLSLAAKAPLERKQEEAPVPLCILTGWLGAGKTTLLTYLLDTLGKQGKQIAVVQNEGTSMGVEDALRLQDDSGLFGEILELPNGCVCCSVKSDFVLALETLLKKKRFDYVFLECSGLADAGPLARLFWVDEELESNMYLDGIVSLVDARMLEGHLKDEQPHSRQVVRQIAFADRIVLNKVDLVSKEDLSRLSARIRSINPTAKICPTLRSQVCLDDILSIRAFESTDLPVCFQDTHDIHEHFHDHSIASLVFELPSYIDLEKLKQWLGALLWVYEGGDAPTPPTTLSTTAAPYSSSSSSLSASSCSISSTSSSVSCSSTSTSAASSLGAKAAKKMKKRQKYRAKRRNTASNTRADVNESKAMEIFRMKAVLAVQGENKQYFLQAVQQMFEVNPGQSEWGSSPRTSKMIVIGRNLDEESLRKGFASCKT
jgi:G3E family GTPase